MTTRRKNKGFPEKQNNYKNEIQACKKWVSHVIHQYDLLKSALNISAKKSLYTIYFNLLKPIIMCIIFPGNCTSFTSTTVDNFSAYLKILMNESNLRFYCIFLF